MAAHHVRAGKARAAQFTSETQRAAAQALIEQRGLEHMRQIGKRGAKTFYRRYKFVPAGTSGWAIVSRADNTVIRTLGVLPGGAKGDLS